MQKLIARPRYLKQLINFKEKDLIKIVTGIRRCGKSTLFDIFIDYLRNSNVPEKSIVRVNLEQGEFYNITDYQKLYEYIKARLVPNAVNYIFLDEVQIVPDFQKAVNSLFARKDCDIYITGSNSKLLSGELATLLSGRYVEIKMLPLSFQEYLTSFPDQSDLILKYNHYLERGSFPYSLFLENEKDNWDYLDGIFNSVILKDILSRRNTLDAPMLQKVISFVFSNIGNITSSNKIAHTMTSLGTKISVPTIESYLQALTECFLVYKAMRYDIKGKQYLSSGAKYYVADTGLRSYLLGSKKIDVGHLLENIVYLELLRRGYKVFVGKVGTAEIDFIAEKQNATEYYQVAYSTLDESVLARELRPLNSINDHNAKFLLTMDFVPFMSHNGIKQINVLSWLLENNED